jgi:hypothetical protein
VIPVETQSRKVCFGVPAGKLLGFIVSHRGIEANPEITEAIMRMKAHDHRKKGVEAY